MLKNKILTVIIASTFLFSCKEEFLEKSPQDKVTQENFPSNPADALAATNAAYEVLRHGTYHRGFYPIDDIMSDDALKGSSPGDLVADLQPFDVFDHNVTNPFVLNWWRTLYTGVRRTNVVIDRVPAVEMDEELKNRYIGEARFLRALYYSDLARGYGGVPLVKESEIRTDFTRASLTQTYDFIEADLRQAIEVLPEKSDYATDDLGRATKGAAKALLARVYLYQQAYDSAALFAEEVINSQQYELEATFESAFREETEFGLESVFEVGGIGVQGGIAAGNNEYTSGQGVRGTPNRGIGANRPSMDLIESFEEDDPRMQATVIFVGEVLDGIEIIGDSQTPDTTANGQVETYNQKIWVPGTTPFSNTAHNRRLIRYAEVLLIAAEALNRNSQTPQALIYLNEVRERAREGDTSILPDITETNPDLLEDLILGERRHELAMEGHRFWDLVRTDRADEVLGPHGFQTNKHELLPIPQSERDITNGLLEQNPNWN
ncbi:RagB/SusD family nutrient uptake outer membrane protein [Marivirga sp. S37H4]|uniref:RagB/SusD family nutrient uptake outer membrane protein n=1 Tax=Marivirga aurantiaca TaxID=2802615 RepID=A0A934WY50_9BACT|nr:RagB/SusD family nutrient uptake outer membrane protein [Marivirga aurantiaca]MBK6265052.1 RagB/SusD family nutrient uptake outer membrane protein [Marivirga aurantiaca]